MTPLIAHKNSVLRIWIFLSALLFIFSEIGVASQYILPQQSPVISPLLQNRADTTEVHAAIPVWVFFTDKGFTSQGGLQRRLSEPSALITERARDRRIKRGSRNSVVGFDDIPVNKEYIAQVLEIDGVVKHRTTSKWFNGVSIDIRPEAIDAVAGLSFVRKLEVVKQARRSPQENTLSGGRSVLQKSMTSHANLDYGQSFTQLEQINVITAHEAGYSGEGILVLMLDTGYFKDHEAIDTSRIVAEWDFIQDDGDTQNDTLDHPQQHNHGTLTASALGAGLDGVMYGPAYNCDYLLAKTEIYDQEIIQEEDYYVAALEWGDSLGADIASSSLGYFDWYDYSDMDGNTAITTRAVDKAVSNGMLCVTSVGNENNGMFDWDYIIAPSDADSVISVGAVNSSGEIAGFSSRGPTYDGRIKPEVVAMGVNTYAAYPLSPEFYRTVDGTSLSAPLVGGAAALILEAHPEWTPMEVRHALMKTGSRSQSPNNTYGWGIIDVMKAINYTQPSLQEQASIRNYPNPVVSQTTFEIVPPEVVPELTGLTLKIYNIRGESVATLNQSDDTGLFRWNLQEAPWNSLPNGVYIYRLIGPSLNLTNKLTILR